MNKVQILKIYREFHVPKHIIAHMRAVAYVCKCLCGKFAAKNFKIDKNTVISAALLHDTLRIVDFEKIDPAKFPKKPDKSSLECWEKLWKKYHKIGHEKSMAKILRTRGENKMANLIAKHEFFSIWKLKTLEEKILYYADKRVDHDKIVSLEKRFAEGKKRNMMPTDDPEYVAATEEKAKDLEKDFVKILGESIDDF